MADGFAGVAVGLTVGFCAMRSAHGRLHEPGALARTRRRQWNLERALDLLGGADRAMMIAAKTYEFLRLAQVPDTLPAASTTGVQDPFQSILLE